MKPAAAALWVLMGTSASAFPPVACWDRLAKTEPAPFAELGVAVVTAASVHFSNCAAADCETKPYVVAGDAVITSNRSNGWVCAVFPNRRGGTRGWLPASALSPSAIDPNPPLSAWAGTWQMHENATIAIKPAGEQLAISGEAYWINSITHGAHVGEIDSKSRPKGTLVEIPSPDELDAAESAANPEFSCAAKLRLLSPYLVVEDNGHCGGMNVSFTGAYRRTAK